MLTVLTLGSRCWGALCRRRTRLEEIGWGRPDHTSADSTDFERGELGVFAEFPDRASSVQIGVGGHLLRGFPSAKPCAAGRRRNVTPG
jgi:hypothetical protein